jgi:predicted nuclease of predicted toxin-antitoxin system
MRFIVDAQLPLMLCDILRSVGFEAMHVDALPKGDETPDGDIAAYADREGLMVMTKDTDFYHSHMIRNVPRGLFLITTGNLRNRALFDHIRNNAVIIRALLEKCNYIELTNDGVIGHGPH